MNYKGFTKIIKKYEKVTGFKLEFMPLVDVAFPFTPNSRDALQQEINKVVGIYARMNTNEDLSLSLKELNQSVREQFVWSRNTIWRDMIETERKSTAVAVIDNTTMSKLFFQVVDYKLFGASFRFLDISGKCMKFIYATVLFVVLVHSDLFPSVEQNSCFALLMYASVLWALEVTLFFDP